LIKTGSSISIEIPVQKGVSQRDFLSPTLVMIEIINEINSKVRHDVKIRNMDLKIRSHADDTVLLAQMNDT
jgi:hypothetical protein